MQGFCSPWYRVWLVENFSFGKFFFVNRIILMYNEKVKYGRIERIWWGGSGLDGCI